MFAMNSGGGGYVAPNGVVYQADRYYNGGSTASTPATIEGTEDVPLYQTERYGNFSYSIPLAGGTYEVSLRFTESYWSSAGRRVFDVWMEGTKVISNLDIFALVGRNRAYDVTIPVKVTDGTLDLTFQASADYGKVSAILITPTRASAGTIVFAVNSGGPQYNHPDGTKFEPDRNYSGGATWTTSPEISGAINDSLYQSEKYGNFSYSIPLPAGDYTVGLRFAEIYWWSPGRRVFDVYVQGAKVMSSFDIFAVVGRDAAYMASFPATVTNWKPRHRFQHDCGQC
jgi:hypothetical protein